MIYEMEDWFDRATRKLYKFGAKMGLEFQVWRLKEGAINANEGEWIDLPNPVFSCHIHLYRIKP